MTNAKFWENLKCLPFSSLGKNTEDMHSSKMVKTAKPKSRLLYKTRHAEGRKKGNLFFCHNYKHSIYRWGHAICIERLERERYPGLVRGGWSTEITDRSQGQTMSVQLCTWSLYRETSTLNLRWIARAFWCMCILEEQQLNMDDNSWWNPPLLVIMGWWRSFSSAYRAESVMLNANIVVIVVWPFSIETWVHVL